MNLTEIIKAQVLDDARKQRRRGASPASAKRYAIGCAIFNHGVVAVREAFGLPAPRIRSIFYRSDCFYRCQLAAKQMLGEAL